MMASRDFVPPRTAAQSGVSSTGKRLHISTAGDLVYCGECLSTGFLYALFYSSKLNTLAAEAHNRDLHENKSNK